MNHGNTSKLLAGLFALLLVLGPASSVAWGENGSKVAIVAFGLFGDQSVFESEAKGAAAILANRFGGGPVIVRANTRRGGGATPETLASTLDSVAKEIDHERDLLVLILTSHGSPAGLAVKAGAREEMRARSGRDTVPQIFIGERHVGGCDELHALDADGSLDALLINRSPGK